MARQPDVRIRTWEKPTDLFQKYDNDVSKSIWLKNPPKVSNGHMLVCEGNSILNNTI